MQSLVEAKISPTDQISGWIEKKIGSFKKTNKTKLMPQSKPSFQLINWPVRPLHIAAIGTHPSKWPISTKIGRPRRTNQFL
jgi:hypothetical protein